MIISTLNSDRDVGAGANVDDDVLLMFPPPPLMVSISKNIVFDLMNFKISHMHAMWFHAFFIVVR